MAHSETSDHAARRASLFTASVLGVLMLVGCNVYDPSLLEQGSLAAGATDSGGSSGSSGDIGVGGSITNGGTYAGAGSDNGDKGGATAGGAGTTAAGSSSGGTSAGGTAGSNGSSGAAGGVVVGGSGGSVEVGGSAAGGAVNTSLSMIDDMENPDQYIPATDGRAGFWSLANDGTKGTQTPSIMVMSQIVGGRGASMYALHTTSTGFTGTGAHVDVDLNRKAARMPYDASAYKAVHFWAKVAPGSLSAVHFAIPDLHTDPGGELCTKSGQQCYDHFAVDLPTLTNAWAEYTVQFADLSQYSWGMNGVTALDAAHVFGIQFSWGIPTMDLWIDDLAFVKK